jgi:hypothetical protein
MSKRFICTKENPWTKEKGERSAHPDAEEIDADYGSLARGGSHVQYKCPHCGLTFWEELPD